MKLTGIVLSALFSLVIVSAFIATTGAQAQLINGAITPGDPIFDRPDYDDASCVDGDQDDTYYDVHSYVHSGGTVGFTVLASASGFGTLTDSFLIIYSTSFNPASPCTNFVLVNDDAIERADDVDEHDSTIVADLPAGTYQVVVTGFDSTDLGTYVLAITNGTTVGGDIDDGDGFFTRADDDPPCSLSSEDVYYETHTVNHPGGILALDVHADDSSNAFQGYGTIGDPYLTLYSSPFNPASGCTNYINADDDDGIDEDSVMFFTGLPAGTYIAVVSGYDDTEFGSYEFSYTSFAPPTIGSQIVPAMNEWGMIIFMLLAGCISVYYLYARRKNIKT